MPRDYNIINCYSMPLIFLSISVPGVSTFAADKSVSIRYTWN